MIVIVAVPRVAVAVAVNETVTVQVGLHGLLVKAAVTPVGRPDAVKVTPVVVPLTSVAVIDDVELVVPRTTVRLFGDGVDKEKSKGAATVSESWVVGLSPPPVAVIVTVTVPRVAVAVAVNDRVTVHVGLHGLFVKVAVTPVGRADVENVTEVVVPAPSVAVIEDVGLVDP